MPKILQSASKLVFLTLTISACIGFFMKLLDADKFMLLCTGAFSFYFANKPIDRNGEITK